MQYITQSKIRIQPCAHTSYQISTPTLFYKIYNYIYVHLRILYSFLKH